MTNISDDRGFTTNYYISGKCGLYLKKRDSVSVNCDGQAKRRMFGNKVKAIRIKFYTCELLLTLTQIVHVVEKIYQFYASSILRQAAEWPMAIAYYSNEHPYFGWTHLQWSWTSWETEMAYLKEDNDR